MSLLLLDGRGEQRDAPGTAPLSARTAEIGRDWPAFEWAHAYERAWCVVVVAGGGRGRSGGCHFCRCPALTRTL